jgi:hypothetical protein
MDWAEMGVLTVAGSKYERNLPCPILEREFPPLWRVHGVLMGM